MSRSLSAKPNNRTWTERKRTALTAYMFISPFFVLFAVFGLFPIVFTFYLSFFRWNALTPMKFVGLQNYQFIFEDKTFWTSVMNTFLMGAMGTIPQLIVALLLAVTLNSAVIRFRRFFRTLYFMPTVTSIVAVTLVFSVIFGNQGMANGILTSFDFEPVAWNSGWWGMKIAIATMIMWRWTGYNTIILLAGLQSISPELYEAAKIDGAGKSALLFKITMPLLQPFILFVILMSTIGSLQLFTEPFVFTGREGTGGARLEAITMVIYLYREAFYNTFFGTAAATAVFLFFLTILISIVNVWIANRLNSDGGAWR